MTRQEFPCSGGGYQSRWNTNNYLAMVLGTLVKYLFQPIIIYYRYLCALYQLCGYKDHSTAGVVNLATA
jgi:hypothetical protein